MKASAKVVRKENSKFKFKIVKDALLVSLTSKLVHLFIITTVAAVFTANTKHWQFMVVTLLFAVIYRQRLVFEMMLIEHSVEAYLGYFKWYSLVDDGLVLGGIPLFEPHYDLISTTLGMNAILSIVEPFEYTVSTVVGRPVTESEWKKVSVEQLVITSPDYCPPSFEALDAGAEFLNSHLVNGRKVYCHCKSGVGRSASVIVAYYMRYKRYDAKTAHSSLKLRRPAIFSANSPQMKNLIAYEAHIRKGVTSGGVSY